MNKLIFVVFSVLLLVTIGIKMNQTEEPVLEVNQVKTQGSFSQVHRKVESKTIDSSQTFEEETLSVTQMDSLAQLKDQGGQSYKEYIDPNEVILAKDKERLDHAAELDSMAAFEYEGVPSQPITTMVYGDRNVN